MKIKYDKSIDALYITLKKGKVLKTKEQAGHLMDYDKKGNLLGLEILNFSKFIARGHRISRGLEKQKI